MKVLLVSALVSWYEKFIVHFPWDVIRIEISTPLLRMPDVLLFFFHIIKLNQIIIVRGS